MLEDRRYARESVYRDRQPLSVQLMIALTAIYALQAIDQVYIRSNAEAWLALSIPGLRRGFVWQLVTFQFLHGGLLHLAGNLIGLWFFGRWVEEVLGRKRFALVYFGGGVLGGLLQAILMALFPRHFGQMLFGASAGVYALLAVFARLESGAEIRLYFVLPISAKAMLWILGGISLFFTLVPADLSVAHAAHLGGLAAGIGFVHLGWHHDYVPLPWEGWLLAWRQKRRQNFSKPPQTPSRRPRERDTKTSAGSPPETLSADFISREVDPILDKISAHGIHSLTDRERTILEAARGRMSRR
jgi:membrane associated rhomboid family serine protease